MANKSRKKEEQPEGAIVGNGEIHLVDAKALEDADDLRALNEALAEGNVKPFDELSAELGLA